VLDFGCGVGELARIVAAPDYVGVDVDAESLDLARGRFPQHRFLAPGDLPGEERFDTVVALAVVEHAQDPAGLVARLAGALAPAGRLVLTTPHPVFEPVHDVAARLGLASRDANEDHEALLRISELEGACTAAGLEAVAARRFLAGMNQLVVAQRPAGADAAERLGNT